MKVIYVGLVESNGTFDDGRAWSALRLQCLVKSKSVYTRGTITYKELGFVVKQLKVKSELLANFAGLSPFTEIELVVEDDITKEGKIESMVVGYDVSTAKSLEKAK